MEDNRCLKPTTPEFQAELVFLLARICRHLLDKHQQERKGGVEPALSIVQETAQSAALADRS